MRRSILVSLGLALTTAGTLAAQAPGKGSVDIGLFGRYAMYPSEIDVNGGMGGGARIGIHLGGGIALEADGGWMHMTRKLPNGGNTYDIGQPLHFRLAYHRPFGAGSKLIVGAGYTKESIDPKLAFRQQGTGLGLLFGIQHDFGQTVGLRVEGTFDKFGDGGAFVKAGNIIGVDAGLNFFFGTSTGPKDSDRDGVLDTADACPGTAAGERVDARGCALPKDADADGVTDPNDACPGTMAGERVDARGCPLPRDADHDGVTDNSDRCAGTPMGVAVDANGCPRDTDGDGVADNNDRCAGTPAGTPVDATGCPRDSDGDGVADTADRCPGTPSGTAVDGNGCPLPDTDGDKVVDRDDKCPNTPPGLEVDSNGCQRLFNVAAGKTTLVLSGVNFRSGSSALTTTSRPILDRVAEALVNNPTVKVEVGGHTDNSGSAATNRRLSQARANSVRAYLISKGVDGSRITAVGYGPDSPTVPNTTRANRATNRRVELKQVP